MRHLLPVLLLVLSMLALLPAHAQGVAGPAASNGTT